MTAVQAPAVHTRPWKHWSFREGEAKLKHTVPDDGCGTIFVDGIIRIIDERTRRQYDFEPLHPDVLEWEQEHQAELSAYWMARHRAMSSQPANGGRTPQQSPASGRDAETQASGPGPFTAAGYIVWAKANNFRASPITLFESFFGVTQIPQSPGCSISIWTGLQNNSNYLFLLQPYMFHNYNDPTNAWTMWNSYNYGPIVNGVQVGARNYGGSAFSLAVPGGYGFAAWSVIRHVGYPQSYSMGFYKGVSSNRYADINKPYMSAFNLYLPTDAGPPGLDQPSPAVTGAQIGRFYNASCAWELAAPAAAPYYCSDISGQVVFGGMLVKDGPEYILLDWVQQSPYQIGSGTMPTCSTSWTAQSPTTKNPYTQLTFTVNPT